MVASALSTGGKIRHSGQKRQPEFSTNDWTEVHLAIRPWVLSTEVQVTEYYILVNLTVICF